MAEKNFTKLCPHCDKEFRSRRTTHTYCSRKCGRLAQPIRSPEERFWEKVDRKGPNECWLWTAGALSAGYGSFHYNGTFIGAHRFAWIVTNGPIPEGLFVCHRCDNPPCVNPAHLFIGSAADNIGDKVKKGRQSHARVLGERHGMAKLTESDVRAIRVAQGLTQRQIAALYGVTHKVIGLVRNRLAWTHVE
jgi:hypothetical protein